MCIVDADVMLLLFQFRTVLLFYCRVVPFRYTL